MESADSVGPLLRATSEPFRPLEEQGPCRCRQREEVNAVKDTAKGFSLHSKRVRHRTDESVAKDRPSNRLARLATSTRRKSHFQIEHRRTRTKRSKSFFRQFRGEMSTVTNDPGNLVTTNGRPMVGNLFNMIHKILSI